MAKKHIYLFLLFLYVRACVRVCVCTWVRFYCFFAFFAIFAKNFDSATVLHTLKNALF